MSEENPATTVDASAEINSLKKEIELLKQKNREVVEEKQKITSNAKSVASLPEGTDVQALIEFKRKVEQERLEEKGQYSEALNKREEILSSSSVVIAATISSNCERGVEEPKEIMH